MHDEIIKVYYSLSLYLFLTPSYSFSYSGTPSPRSGTAISKRKEYIRNPLHYHQSIKSNATISRYLFFYYFFFFIFFLFLLFLLILLFVYFSSFISASASFLLKYYLGVNWVLVGAAELSESQIKKNSEYPLKWYSLLISSLLFFYFQLSYLIVILTH